MMVKWNGCLVQNVVQYAGGRADREVIRKHEFFYPGDKSKNKQTKFDVLLVRKANDLTDLHVHPIQSLAGNY